MSSLECWNKGIREGWNDGRQEYWYIIIWEEKNDGKEKCE
jgi:hypothetical protein